MDCACCKQYVQILKEELVPAMGCTEPIAVAYAAAKAREVLGCMPEKTLVEVSGNIIKNAKSMVGEEAGLCDMVVSIRLTPDNMTIINVNKNLYPDYVVADLCDDYDEDEDEVVHDYDEYGIDWNAK